MELIRLFPYVPSSMIDDKNAFDMDFTILEEGLSRSEKILIFSHLSAKPWQTKLIIGTMNMIISSR